MPKHFSNLFGWFDFDDIYREAVSRYDNCTFIEIGSFQGKSACYMGELIKESGKNIKLVCIDLFPTKEELDQYASIGAGQGVEGQIIRGLPDTLENTFKQNIKDGGVDDVVSSIKTNSHDAAKSFVGRDDIKFVFVDAGHGYDTVKEDIKLWLANVSPDGIIAGHDYFDGVYKAVNEIFKDENRKVYRKTSSWYIDLAKREDYV